MHMLDKNYLFYRLSSKEKAIKLARRLFVFIFYKIGRPK